MRAAAKLAHPATAHPAPAIENIDVARIFEKIADLLEIQRENPFRIRAYRNAARTIQSLSVPVASLVGKEKALEKLPGIGADLAGKIREIVETGALGLVTQLTRRTPETLVQLMHVPGLGPKRAQLIYKKLHIKTLDDLDRAAPLASSALCRDSRRRSNAECSRVWPNKRHGPDARAWQWPMRT